MPNLPRRSLLLLPLALAALAAALARGPAARADDTPPAPPPAGVPDAGGPIPDGPSLTFDKLGLTWTLPKAAKAGENPPWGFAQAGNPHLGKGATGVLAVAVLAGDGESLRIELHLPQASPGFYPKLGVSNEENFKADVQTNFDGTPVPNIDEDVAVGNWHGASRSLTGKGKDGKPLYMRYDFVALKNVVYETVLVALDGAETKHHPDIRAALAGLKWDDTNDGVRGPWAVPFPSFTDTRPDLQEEGKETPFSAVLLKVTLKKPAGFGRIKYVQSDPGMEPWAFAAEERKAGAYLFVGIMSMEFKVLQNGVPPKDADNLIDDHESEWKNALSDPKTLTQRSGKANKAQGSFAGGRGFTYRFEGTSEGQPVVEHGWVVKAGTKVYWVRAQFCGKDAEKTLGDDWTKLQRSIKFD